MRCTFPDCDLQASTRGRNRAGQAMCVLHLPVVVAITDDLGRGRHSEGVDDQ